MKTNFSAVIHQEENLYVALCPEVGVASQGETTTKALANLTEAVELYLSEFPLKEPLSKPILTTFEAELDAIAS